ncbi:ABC transporter substrate-binding protein [Chengkuizengella axinellae]|uniref:Extracellular solute-binding protein n=1 Tax=Chengkuizengella axinellae TaxID=3064388 RepID=A0ABT9J0K2_9BACL|nr:extracellular solute-binding protein [Chengkuizengella sp. 2205SS18-9]MDP5275149.1 extracellular solute-binding protein [Chengkuizengella sp. 2205SS18-9]
MKRFGLILMSLMLLFSFALAACSSSEEGGEAGEGTPEAPADGGEEATPETPEGVIELTFASIANTGFGPLIEKYNAENENVQINFQEQSFDDHHNAFATALAAGSGVPDIAFVEIGRLEGFKASQDSFTNLYDFGAKDVTGIYLDWKIAQAENADGSFLFGLPTDIGPMAMAYRTDIFEEAGLPTDPNEVSALITDWDKYIEVGKTVLEKTGKPMSDSAGTMFDTFTGQLTELYFTADDELILESNAAVKEAYDRSIEIAQSGLSAKLGQWSGEWSTGMNEGTFATLMAPAWMMNYMTGSAPDASGKWNIAQMPVASGNWGGSFLTVPASTEYPQEAYDFIEWLVNEENSYEVFKETGNFPSIPGIYEKPEIQDWTSEYFSGAYVGKIYAEAALRIQPVWLGTDYATVHNALKDAINNVDLNGADPEAAWNEAMDTIKRELR